MVVSSIRKVAVCAVTSAGASRMNDANVANANLPTMGVAPCFAITARSAAVEGKSPCVLRVRADRDRVARTLRIKPNFQPDGDGSFRALLGVIFFYMATSCAFA